MTSNFVVKVLHNVSPDTFFRYHPDTSQLFHAHDFLVEARDAEAALNVVWELANADPEDLSESSRSYIDQVREYRKRKNRSLSVSDVLIVSEVLSEDEPGVFHGQLLGVFVVAALGHEALEFMPPYQDGRLTTETSESYEAHRRLFV